MRGGCGDAILKAKQFLRSSDVDEENSRPIENTEVFNSDWNRRRAHLSQLCDEAGVLLRRRIPEKLQSDMPRFWRSPAKAARSERRRFETSESSLATPAGSGIAINRRIRTRTDPV